MPAERIAILDACILVQAPLRDTLLRLAEAPALYQPKWPDEIIREMRRTLESKIGLPVRKSAYLEREIRRHFPSSSVEGSEALIRRMRMTGMFSPPPSKDGRR